MEIKTPIAIFAYNRPVHLRRLLESLVANPRLDECDVVIYCDGPKTKDQETNIEATREVAREWASRLNATIVCQAMNRGLAKSIISGVTELCCKYGRAIVLEDDLIVAPGFLNFMLTALVKYRDEERVYEITGHMFPITHNIDVDAIFLPCASTWGWATWERAWKHFDVKADAARNILANPRLRHAFDLNGAINSAEMLEGCLRGEIDSWGILWWLTVFSRNGYTLHPVKSLVRNCGFDSSGTHCSNNPYYHDNLEWITDVVDYKLPEKVEIDVVAFRKIQDVLRVKATLLKFASLSSYKASLLSYAKKAKSILIRLSSARCS